MILLATSLKFGSSALGQNETFRREFEHRLPLWMAESHVPAVAITLIENNTVVFSKVYGFQKDRIPVSDSTVFNVASLTKPVITMLTLKLVSIKQWNLDEPLWHYWTDPDLRLDERHKRLTTRMVLSHTTGLPNWRWTQDKNKLAFQFDPGSTYQYSGEGFEYLRRAIEAKMKKPIEDLCRDYIFSDCEMNATRFGWSGEFTGRFAEWHDKNGQLIGGDEARTRSVSAADDLMCTISDYAKFVVSVLNQSGLTQPVFEEMISAQARINEEIDQGLGWTVIRGLPAEEYALYHGGADKGVRTAVLIFPKSKRAIIVFSNGEGGVDIVRKMIRTSIKSGELIINKLSKK